MQIAIQIVENKDMMSIVTFGSQLLSKLQNKYVKPVRLKSFPITLLNGKKSIYYKQLRTMPEKAHLLTYVLLVAESFLRS